MIVIELKYAVCCTEDVVKFVSSIMIQKFYVNHLKRRIKSTILFLRHLFFSFSS